MKPDSKMRGHGDVEIFKYESQDLIIQTLSRVMVTSSSSFSLISFKCNISHRNQ